jgi:serine/threonine-protein kinase
MRPLGRTLGDSTPVATDPDAVDHVGALARMRRFALAGLLTWTSAVGLDVLAAHRLAPGSLGYLLALRLAGATIILGTWARLRMSPPPSPRGLRVWVVTAFTLACVAMSAMGAAAGGFSTPYFGGVLLCLSAYGLCVHSPWRRGAFDAAWVTLAFPVTLLVAWRVSPSVAAQLDDPHAQAVFQFDVTNLLIMYVIVVVTGHVAWSLRRQVFEARSVGRYKLKHRLGAGGMGEVWVAYHHGLKRDVAVKILRSEGGNVSPSAVARFEREVRATAELTHPNTIRLFDYGVTDDGLCYYVMELVEGEDIAALVARAGAQPPARALYLVAQAARALAEAHAKGIVHRDVKPENLIVTRAGGEHDFVKVLDFGIAKRASGREEAGLTRTGWVIGTPMWLPPEAFAGTAVGPPADVYALGGVLYLLLSGEPPIHATSFAAYAEAHTRQTPARLPDTVPEDLQGIVMRCLRKSPDDRFRTARELADALADCHDAGRWSALDAACVVEIQRAPRDPMGDTRPTELAPEVATRRESR